MTTGTHTPEDLEMFLYYGGDKSKPKFSKDDILKNAITFNHCKVCDRSLKGESEVEHLRSLRRDLTAYLGKRRAAAERAKAAGLRKGRAKKAEADITEPVEDDDE